MTEDELFFVGQKAIIEHNGSILLLNDPDIGDDLPGGKIQKGETDFVKALQREVCEETTLEIKVGKPLSTDYKPIAHPQNTRDRGKFIFVVFYSCEYVSGEVGLSDEHDAFKWITKENYKTEVTSEWILKQLDTYFEFKDLNTGSRI